MKIAEAAEAYQRALVTEKRAVNPILKAELAKKTRAARDALLAACRLDGEDDAA